MNPGKPAPCAVGWCALFAEDAIATLCEHHLVGWSEHFENWARVMRDSGHVVTWLGTSIELAKWTGRVSRMGGPEVTTRR